MPVSLRSLHQDDLPLLTELELSPRYQAYTTLRDELDETMLLEFIHSEHNLEKQGQFRFVIDTDEGAVGFADLYDYDPEQRQAGVGILMRHTEQRKGYGLAALQLLDREAAHYHIHMLLAEIRPGNEPARRLFEKAGYCHSPEHLATIEGCGVWKRSIPVFPLPL